MRLLALLLSLYLTCLSCLPCADERPEGAAPAPASISAASHSDCGHTLGDWCSPLCQCHCCAGAVVTLLGTPGLAYVEPAPWAAGHRHAPLVVASPTRVAGAVWQPPQA